MSCAKGCRGPVREPDSSRAHAGSLLASGFLAEAVPAEETRRLWSWHFWALAFPRVGKGFSVPVLLCREVGACGGGG